jgi:hypothetical protein
VKASTTAASAVVQHLLMNAGMINSTFARSTIQRSSTPPTVDYVQPAADWREHDGEFALHGIHPTCSRSTTRPSSASSDSDSNTAEPGAARVILHV